MELPRPNPEQFMAPSLVLPRLGEDTPITRGLPEIEHDRDLGPQFLRPDRHAASGGVYAVRAALGDTDNPTPQSSTNGGDTVAEGLSAPNAVGASEPREPEASKEAVAQQADTVDPGSQDLEFVETDGAIVHDDTAILATWLQGYLGRVEVTASAPNTSLDEGVRDTPGRKFNPKIVLEQEFTSEHKGYFVTSGSIKAFVAEQFPEDANRASELGRTLTMIFNYAGHVHSSNHRGSVERAMSVQVFEDLMNTLIHETATNGFSRIRYIGPARVGYLAEKVLPYLRVGADEHGHKV